MRIDPVVEFKAGSAVVGRRETFNQCESRTLGDVQPAEFTGWRRVVDIERRLATCFKAMGCGTKICRSVAPSLHTPLT